MSHINVIIIIIVIRVEHSVFSFAPTFSLFLWLPLNVSGAPMCALNWKYADRCIERMTWLATMASNKNCVVRPRNARQRKSMWIDNEGKINSVSQHEIYAAGAYMCSADLQVCAYVAGDRTGWIVLYIYLHSLAFYYAMQLCSIAAVEIFSNLTRAIRH